MGVAVEALRLGLASVAVDMDEPSATRIRARAFSTSVRRWINFDLVMYAVDNFGAVMLATHCGTERAVMRWASAAGL